MIEKGRHMRPRIECNERKCFICKNDVEDEIHFLTKCPLYDNERLYEYFFKQVGKIAWTLIL